MAEFYVWTASELGLDILPMDNEHQELIKRMNTLYTAVEKKIHLPRLRLVSMS